MDGLASVTRRFPSTVLSSRLRHVWHLRGVSNILKLQWLTFSATAPIPGQALRAFVTMIRPATTIARRLPVTGEHNGIVFRIIGGRLGSQLHCDGFPLRPMSSLWTSKRMRDFVHQRIEHFLSRILSRVVLCNLNALCAELANTQPTLRLSPAESPVMQSVLLQFPLSNLLNFLYVHDTDKVLSGK